MIAPIDLTNKKFGRLVALRVNVEEDTSFRRRWVCKCDCGNPKEILVVTSSLTNGQTTSCGCLQKERAREAKTTHGFAHTPEYGIWCGIKRRCYNVNEASYPRYGGRGITMSDDWKESFEAFYRDMGPRPSCNHSIEREKNDKGYEAGNCKWATIDEQANNRRSSIHYAIGNELKTLKEWCVIRRMNYQKVYYRINRLGWEFEEAIQPVEHTSITFDGVTKTLVAWCDLLDLKLNKTCLRILRGETFEDIVKET